MFATVVLQSQCSVSLTCLWRGCRVYRPGPGGSACLSAAGPTRCSRWLRWRLSGCRSLMWPTPVEPGGNGRWRVKSLTLARWETTWRRKQTDLGVLLCRRFWEVQVEGGLTGAEQLVRQVHVDIWTKTNWRQHLQEAANTFELQVHSLWMPRSWALFFRDTISLVFVARALNLPRPPLTGSLAFLGAEWANRWSRYWARSSASGGDGGGETEKWWVT